MTPSSEDRHDLPAEDARIAAHLARAERQARLRDVSRLPTAVRSVRAFALDTLADYRRAGRFPRNHVAHARTPIFIDPHGTRCAMAHLLERIGAGELVARVARTANEARVHALAADGELLRWLGAMGLSVEEAAAIQPTYCYTPKAACWCGGEPSTFDFLVTGTLATSAGAQRTVHVDAVHRGASVKIGEDLAVDHTNATDGEHVVVTGMTLSGARNNGAVIPSDQYAFTPCAPIVAQLPLSEAEVLAALESTDWPRRVEGEGRAVRRFGVHRDERAARGERLLPRRRRLALRARGRGGSGGRGREASAQMRRASAANLLRIIAVAWLLLTAACSSEPASTPDPDAEACPGDVLDAGSMSYGGYGTQASIRCSFPTSCAFSTDLFWSSESACFCVNVTRRYDRCVCQDGEVRCDGQRPTGTCEFCSPLDAGARDSRRDDIGDDSGSNPDADSDSGLDVDSPFDAVTPDASSRDTD